MIRIGSARINSKGGISGDKAGDQKQKGIPDYSGEVCIEKFYVWKEDNISGWVVMRPKAHGEAVAKCMVIACNNINVGYGQDKRGDILTDGVNSTKPTTADCSSLLRDCIKEATGVDVGYFTTSNEVKVLMKSGLFEAPFQYSSKTPLRVGDVLISGKLPYGTKGHTAIVVEADDPVIHADYATRLYGNTAFLPVVRDTEDYAGIEGRGIDGLTIKVSKGSIKYRLHDETGWTSWCANNAPCISKKRADAVQIYYYTPEDYAAKYGYKCAMYQVSPLSSKAYYPIQIDDDKDASRGMDGYAGAFGKPFDKLRLYIG